MPRHHRSLSRKRSLVLLPLLMVSSAIGAPPTLENAPKEALRLLESLPQQKVSLDLVVSGAVEFSDHFRTLMADRTALEVPQLQSKVPLENRLTFNGTRGIDKREPQNPFMPSRSTNTAATLGYTTYFRSGTAISSELMHGKTDIDFQFSSGLNYFETSAGLTISQNLWKDRFGKGTRSGLEAGSLQTEANTLLLEEGVADFVFQMVQIFYQAWYVQREADAAASSVERRKRLLDITRIKLRRGTSERPDFLQIESALLSNRAQESDANQRLGELWRELLTILKLPKEWMQIDPRAVPMILDTPVESALTACGGNGHSNPPPKETTVTRRHTAEAKAAEKFLENAESAASPDLKFNVSLGANGIDPISRRTWNETFAVDHPAWSLSLDFSIPISFYQEEADIRQARASRDRAEALRSKSRGDKDVQWINTCADLKRWIKTTEYHEKSFENQKARLNLEERRFRIGRVPTLNVIQAGDDTTQAELGLRNAQVMTRLAAWRIRKIVGGIKPYLNELKKKDFWKK